MRLHSTIRRLTTAAALLLAVGVSGVLAQDTQTTVTPAPEIAPLQLTGGACPQGLGVALRDQMMAELGIATPEAPADSGMMTEEPLLEATSEMNLTGTQPTDVKCLFGWFSGATEVPGPGDGDSFGVAFVSVNPTTAEICYEVAVTNITLPADAMHIHNAPVGESGDVVVPFQTAPDASGTASECFFMFDRYDLLEDIAANPSNYYVNIHTSDFPDGATRAQLLDWGDTTPSDLGLSEVTPEAANG
ncbi:MAG: CHRD domain-containing protein [Anaerolineae bacterium]|nr:CHRD domain-containing protein [Anaerolineae bacterium]